MLGLRTLKTPLQVVCLALVLSSTLIASEIPTPQIVEAEIDTCRTAESRLQQPPFSLDLADETPVVIRQGGQILELTMASAREAARRVPGLFLVLGKSRSADMTENGLGAWEIHAPRAREEVFFPTQEVQDCPSWSSGRVHLSLMMPYCDNYVLHGATAFTCLWRVREMRPLTDRDRAALLQQGITPRPP